MELAHSRCGLVIHTNVVSINIPSPYHEKGLPDIDLNIDKKGPE